jgi:hypothetical protein
MAFLEGYTQRKQLTIRRTRIDEALADFPVLVKISADAEIGAAARADGYDLRFTAADGATPLAFERISFAIAGGLASGVFYVLVPQLASSADTRICLYYGNPEATDGQDAAEVWQDAAGAWHLEANFLDSGPAAAHGTNSGTTDTAGAGGVGRGRALAGDSYVSTPITQSLTTFTASAWVRWDGSGGARNILSKDSPASRGWVFRLRDGYIEAEYNGNVDGNGYTQLNTTDWYHVAMVADGSQIRCYINGVQDFTLYTSIAANSAAVMIGRRPYPSYEEPFQGAIDEPVLETTIRSAAWLKFAYYNRIQADGEITWGAAEARADLTGWSRRKPLAVDHTAIDADLPGFPLLVAISGDADLGGAAQPDGEDLRFTDGDGSTFLPYERIAFSIAGGQATGLFWVKTDLASGADTSLYCYYGKPSAADGQDPTAVWTGYQRVYHLNEASGQALDRASAQHGTYNDATPNRTAFLVDYGQQFDGNAASRITCPDTGLPTGASVRSFGFWYKTTTNHALDQFSAPCGYGTAAYQQMFAPLLGYNSQVTQNAMAITQNGAAFGDTAATNDGQWHHVVFVVGDTSGLTRLYRDGLERTNAYLTYNTALPGNSLKVGVSSDNSSPWTGGVAELRISADVRPEAWLKFEHANLAGADHEIAWGVAEAIGGVWATPTPAAAAWSALAPSTAKGATPAPAAARWATPTATGAGPAWLVGWGWRRAITIKPDRVDATLTSQRCLVEITADAALGSRARADGYDLRFTAGDTRTLIPFEREEYSVSDGLATARFWVNVPSIDPSSGATIYLYYGRASAADASSPATTWGSPYKLVYHCANDPANSGQILDSSGLANTGVKHQTGQTLPEEVDGVVGKAQHTNGASNWIQSTANIGITGAAPRTLEVWVKVVTGVDSCPILGWGSGYTGASCYWRAMAGGETVFSFWGEGGAGYDLATAQLALDHQAHYLVARFDGGTMRLYVDGVLAATGTLSLNTVDGLVYLGANPIPGAGYAEVVLDEARIRSDATLSDAAITFQHWNVASADHELVIAAEEVRPDYIPAPAVARWSTPAVVAQRTVTLSPTQAAWKTPLISGRTVRTPTPAVATWSTRSVATSKRAAPIAAAVAWTAPAVAAGKTVTPSPAIGTWTATTLSTSRSVNPSPVRATWSPMPPTGLGCYLPSPAVARWSAPSVVVTGTATPSPATAAWSIVAPSIERIAAPTAASAAWSALAVSASVYYQPTTARAAWSTRSVIVTGTAILSPAAAHWSTAAVAATHVAAPSAVRAAWVAAVVTVDRSCVLSPIAATWTPRQPSTAKSASPQPLAVCCSTGQVATAKSATPTPAMASWSTPTAAPGQGVAIASLSATWSALALATSKNAAVASVVATWSAPAITRRGTAVPSPVAAVWSAVAPRVARLATPSMAAAAWSAFTPGITRAIVPDRAAASWSALVPTPGRAVCPAAIAAAWSAPAPGHAKSATPLSAAAAWSAPTPGPGRQHGISPAEAAWSAIAPAIRRGVSPLPARSTWRPLVPDPRRHAEPTPATATWSAPAPALGRTATPESATASWAVVVPESSRSITPLPAGADWSAPELLTSRSETPLPAAASWLPGTPAIARSVEPIPAAALWIVPPLAYRLAAAGPYGAQTQYVYQGGRTVHIHQGGAEIIHGHQAGATLVHAGD